jgi:hypothetical protein
MSFRVYELFIDLIICFIIQLIELNIKNKNKNRETPKWAKFGQPMRGHPNPKGKGWEGGPCGPATPNPYPREGGRCMGGKVATPPLPSPYIKRRALSTSFIPFSFAFSTPLSLTCVFPSLELASGVKSLHYMHAAMCRNLGPDHSVPLLRWTGA